MPGTRITAAIFFAAPGDVSLVATNHSARRGALETHWWEIDCVLRSLRRFHPAARGVVLTDEVTPIDRIDTVEIARSRIDLRQVVWYRHLAQRNFIETLDDDELCLFLDSDMIINRSLDPLFTMEGDVVLTWRPGRTFINGGFIAVRGARRARALAFFDRTATVFRERFWHLSGWWGDQEALCAMFEGIMVKPDSTELHSGSEYDVLFLPASLWNCAPWDVRYSSILWPKKDAYVLHFKGKRKRLMEPYWRLHCAPTTPFARLWLWVQTMGRAVAEELRPPPGSRSLRARLRYLGGKMPSTLKNLIKRLRTLNRPGVSS